jgi:hypothetical protein
VSFKEARNLFNDHIKSLSESQEDSKQKGMTASDLVELFFLWVEKNRSKDTFEARRIAIASSTFEWAATKPGLPIFLRTR